MKMGLTPHPILLSQGEMGLGMGKCEWKAHVGEKGSGRRDGA